MRLRFRLVLKTMCLAAAMIAVATSFVVRRSAEYRLAKEIQLAAGIPQKPVEQEITLELVVSGGSNLGEILRSLEISPEVTATVTGAAKPMFNFRRLREGHHIIVNRSSQSRLESICYEIDPDHELWVSRNGDGYKADVRQVPSTVKIEAVAAEVHGSLFESVMAVGEHPELALRLAEIFAYDLDFYTDPQLGDTFRVVLERREYHNGRPPSYGRILMAEYENAGHAYRAILFHDLKGQPVYYSADGKSLQKVFLRSPLKFAARVSSHFSYRRFHPILKTYRPHLGTDYAAPTGTPVQAVASGRVIVSGRRGGGGNVVEIRHANGYVSYYMHLSRRLVRQGQKVQQGQRIGLVGATGLATGPHLDFRLRRYGRFTNFERMHLPPARPVPRKKWGAFAATREKWTALLSAAVVANQHSSLLAKAQSINGD